MAKAITVRVYQNQRLTKQGHRRADLELEQIPWDLRNKTLKKAISKATQRLTVMTRATAKRVTGKQERYGMPHAVPSLHRNIKKKAWESTTTIGGRMQTEGMANVYAASVEYGHQKVLWGNRRPGQRVTDYSFWRATIDREKPNIDRLVISALRQEIDKLGNG